MSEAAASRSCSEYSITLDALRQWEVFQDASDTKLQQVSAFYGFNVPSHIGCQGGAGMIFLTVNDEAFGRGHNCRNVNMLGFPKSHPSYKSEFVSKPSKIPGLSKKAIQQISIGGLIGAAVSECGTLFWWGNCYNRDGDIMPPHAPRSCRRNYIRVSCGHRIMAAIAVSRNVYVWGQLVHNTTRYFNGERLVIDFSVSQISCGAQHLAMMDVRGFVYTWGIGDHGQRGLRELTVVDEYAVTLISQETCINVKCGPFSTFCLTTSHELKACGSNGDHHLGHLSRLRDGNYVSTLTRICLFGTVSDFKLVWNEDYTIKIVAARSDQRYEIVDLYTWGAGLSAYPSYSCKNSFFDIFTTWKVTPGLTRVQFLKRSDEFERSIGNLKHRSKLVSDALLYIYLRDRPDYCREASRFLWKCKDHKLTYMVNLMPCEVSGRDFVFEKFMSDVSLKPQIAPDDNDAACTNEYGSSQDDDSSYFSM